MLPIYRIDPGTGGDPIEDLDLTEFVYVDDRDKLPTLTITDNAANEQYLCWLYVFKGLERWKICKITTITRTVQVQSGASPAYRTITEQSVEYPNGYASYNFTIEDVFMHSYLPQRN